MSWNDATAPAPLVVAVDGPAASGKSTLARRLAASFGLRFLDTGLIYRAAARKLLDQGGDPDDSGQAAEVARSLHPDDLERSDLRGEGIGNVASKISAYPSVRDALLPVQRAFAARPPGAVLAGRDVGTVVCPDAAAKVFVTAGLERRAERRFAELRSRGEEPNLKDVLSELTERDRRDSDREVAPMVVADDARVIDTTELDLEEAFQALRAAVAEKTGGSTA